MRRPVRAILTFASVLEAARISVAAVCDVRDHGARGDNRSDDTAAFARVILSKECSTVSVPPGDYVVKPLPALHNDTEVVLHRGATMWGWRDPRTYPNSTAEYYAQWGQNLSDCFVLAPHGKVCRGAPLLRADHATNVTIRGGGVVDGGGPFYWYNATRLCTPGLPSFSFSCDFWHMGRPLLVAFTGVTDLTMRDITLRNGPFIHMGADGRRVRISGITVEAAAWQCAGYDGAPNTDCVDLSGVDIHVSNSTCHNGDDCFPLLPSWPDGYSARGSAPPPAGTDAVVGRTANVVVEDVRCECGNGMRVMPSIGTPRFGVIENVTYRRITSVNTSSAIRIAALPAQRGLVRNITFEDMVLVNVRGNAIDVDAFGQGIAVAASSAAASAASASAASAGRVTSTAAKPSTSANPCGAGTPPSPLPGSCIRVEGLTIARVTGDADKAGQLLCGDGCTGVRMDDVHIRANASRCCDLVARGKLPPGTCFWSTCVGNRAVPGFSGYNCSGAACGGCGNSARGTFANCTPAPCLVSDGHRGGSVDGAAGHSAGVHTADGGGSAAAKTSPIGSTTATATASTANQQQLPTPTLPQLRYAKSEVVAIFAFSGDEYMPGGMACGGFDARHFQPTNLNFSEWADLAEDFGASAGWISVKGFCGFLLWHTDTKLPDGRPYAYTAREAGQPDLVDGFVKAFNARGLGAGAYYDLDFNWFLGEFRFSVIPPNQTRMPGQQNVTQSEMEAIMFAQLRELWGRYGDLWEIWMDGGYLDYWQDELTELLKLQPEAVVFNGCASNARRGSPPPACVTPNPTCWIGSESGLAPDPTWSTGLVSNASSGVWCPKTVDTPIQIVDTRCPNTCNGDGWNYNKSSQIKSLATLIDTYHASVGHGCTLELNIDMDHTGNPVPSRAARVREFGAWIRECYGAPAASGDGSWRVELDLGRPTPIDRVALTEDITFGQRVRSYAVVATPASGEATLVANGTAVGSKKIDLFRNGSVLVTRVAVTVLQSVGTPHLHFACFGPCRSG